MIRFDKEQRKIALVLFVVGLVAATILALMDQVTKAPIAKAQREALHKSLVQVLPEHHNDPLVDVFEVSTADAHALQIFPAKNNKGNIIAYAWEQIAPDGYSGTIRILMGVSIAGEVVAIRITKHLETPGLGDGITKNMKWLNTFIDKTLANTKWSVKKDGGDFDQFTGATITPRAVVKAVSQGLKMYQDNRNVWLKAERENEDKRHRMNTEIPGGKAP